MTQSCRNSLQVEERALPRSRMPKTTLLPISPARRDCQRPSSHLVEELASKPVPLMAKLVVISPPVLGVVPFRMQSLLGKNKSDKYAHILSLNFSFFFSHYIIS